PAVLLFTATPPTSLYPLSLHDALPIYVRISGSGRNALDFHIAFHIGLIAAAERDVFFHVISKDSGFDPLITHLKGRKVFAARSADRKSTRLNSSHVKISYAVFCLKKKK